MQTELRLDYSAESLLKPQILCIDDDPEIPRIIEIGLRNFKVSVDIAYFGMQGVLGGDYQVS